MTDKMKELVREIQEKAKELLELSNEIDTDKLTHNENEFLEEVANLINGYYDI